MPELKVVYFMRNRLIKIGNQFLPLNIICESIPYYCVMQLNFSGHDTFHCRQFWLKKGYDFLAEGNKFSADDAPIHLGVGKNMVSAIRHWLRSFGITNTSDELSEIAHLIFAPNGYDPFLEDQGTLWLLHYLLLKQDYASIYRIVFTELAQERPDFSDEHFIRLIEERKEGSYNKNTLKKDFTAFYRNYFGRMNAKDVEESFTGILTELRLLQEKKKRILNSKGKEEERSVWVLEKSTRNEIPLEVILFAICDQSEYGNSISFESLYRDSLGLGNVFQLSREGLTIILERLQELPNYDLIFSNEAGVRELQFKSKPNPVDILKNYYG